MPEKMCLNLLLLCGILSQGIIRTFADENIGESSDILIRHKRVLSRIRDEDTRVNISSVPYMVQVKHNNRITCAGSILSHHIVITIPSCVPFDPLNYQVVSSSSRSNYGTFLNVIGIRKRYGNHPKRPTDGIALLTVALPFDFGNYNKPIELHTGPLLKGTLATISGWGHNCVGSPPGTRFPKNLRSIEVPIMAHQDCVNIYRSHNIEISDKDVCTYHPQKYCGHNDGGAPLVVDGYLAGVHLWTGLERRPIDPVYPDVFVVLQHFDYNQWIKTNMQDIEANFQKSYKQ